MPRREIDPDGDYGWKHQQVRAALIQDLQANPGQPCCRCGQAMWPYQRLDLDHTDDKQGYRGLAHSRCNRGAGAQIGNRSESRRREQPERELPHSQRW